MNWPSKAASAAMPDGAVDDDVVAGTAVEHVLPAAADQDVVSGTTGQDVVAGAADQDVVAVAAIGGELHACQSPDATIDVVAAETVDDEAIVGVEVRDRHIVAKARHRDHAVIVGDGDDVVASVR